MRSFIGSSFASAVFAALAADATAHSSALDAAGIERLAALRQAPELAGALVYRGSVFARRSPGAAPLFTYERRVARIGDGLTSAHITRDTNGDVIITEQAEFNAAYALQRFDAINAQLGYSGSVGVSNGGRHLEYRLIQDGRITTASEDVADPVVTGPSLHGLILHQWDALAAGKTIRVRMIVMTKRETYGFEIRRQSQANGRTSFSITPSSLIVRMLVAPLTVTFDSATRNVVRYEGRVPPMQLVNGKLEALDARVEYTMNVAVYR